MPTLWTGLEREWGPALNDHLNDIATARVEQAFAELRRVDRCVVGFGFGPKRVGGVATERASVIVFVERKRPAAQLPPSHLVPSMIGEWETDVVAVGRLVTKAYRHTRPVPWGCGIELPDTDPADPSRSYASLVGTLGGVVMPKEDDPLDRFPHGRDLRRPRGWPSRKILASIWQRERLHGERFLLSNAHVIAPGAREDITPPTDAATMGAPVQQGLHLNPHDRIGRLVRSVRVKAMPDGGSPAPEHYNFVDAAIARVERDAKTDELLVKEDLEAPTHISGWRASADLVVGLPLRYRGFQVPGAPASTPGTATGDVVAVAVRAVVVYEGRDAYFVDQIAMSGHAIEGNSGALAYTADVAGAWTRCSLVGLVFAGTQSATTQGGAPIDLAVTLLNPIETVFDQLAVTRGHRWTPPSAVPWAPRDWPLPWRRPTPPPPPLSLAAWLARRGVAADIREVRADEGDALEVRGVPETFALPSRWGDSAVLRG